MEWLRWYHGAVSDSKWPVIARKSGASVGTVVAVWAALLEHASQDEERGSISDFDPETFDVLFGFTDGTCAAVVAAMEDKKLLAAGCIASWGKRQVKDEGAAERKRLQREREKLERDWAELHALREKIEQTQINKEDVTGCHGLSQNVTECHLEQNREDKNIRTTPSPPLEGCDVGDAPLNSRRDGTNPRAVGTNPREEGTNPRVLGTNPRAAIEPNVDDDPDESEEPPATPLEGMDMGFQEFLAAYPAEHVQPIGGAINAWKTLARQRALPGLPRILDAITGWEASEQWQKDGGAFIPKAENFLRKRLWLGTPSRASPQVDVAGAIDRLRKLGESKNIITIPG